MKVIWRVKCREKVNEFFYLIFLSLQVNFLSYLFDQQTQETYKESWATQQESWLALWVINLTRAAAPRLHTSITFNEKILVTFRSSIYFLLSDSRCCRLQRGEKNGDTLISFSPLYWKQQPPEYFIPIEQLIETLNLTAAQTLSGLERQPDCPQLMRPVPKRQK